MSGISFVSVSDDRFGRKNGKYSETQDLVSSLIRKLDFDSIHSWKWEDILKTDFYEANKRILDHQNPDINGRCYKPFVILESLKSTNPGDFLIYNDVSPEHWRNFSFDRSVHSLSVIKDLCDANQGILSSEVIWICNGEITPHTHENFTTERCMNRMGLQKYKHSLQHASGMMVFKNTPFVVQYLEEWLYWNLIDECASLTSWHSNENYFSQELDCFGKIGHRHDQSISGLLLNDRNLKIIKNTGEFNFASLCRKDMDYRLIETNIPPSEYIYKNVMTQNGWLYRKEHRDPSVSNIATTSNPLRLR
jgi:hypothetical protein